MLPVPSRLAGLALLLLVVGCAAPSQRAPGTSQTGLQTGQTASPRVNRALVMAGRSETPSVASRPMRIFGLTSTTVSRLFNAGLMLRDGEGNFRPYLAE